MSGPCAGMRVLIVEDEFYQAEDLAQELRDQGAEVVGPVGTVEAAAGVVEEAGFDFAVIDMDLHGLTAAPIADRLLEQGVQFVIATGYDGAALPDRFGALPRIEKPCDPAALVSHVAAARGLARASDGATADAAAIRFRKPAIPG